jgi:hypothetical protein
MAKELFLGVKHGRQTADCQVTQFRNVSLAHFSRRLSNHCINHHSLGFFPRILWNIQSSQLGMGVSVNHPLHDAR